MLMKLFSGMFSERLPLSSPLTTHLGRGDAGTLEAPAGEGRGGNWRNSSENTRMRFGAYIPSYL